MDGDASETNSDGRKPLPPKLRQQWHEFEVALARFEAQREQVQHGFAFAFVEGSLVKALRQGQWLLLDEINLAGHETLECLNGLLESSTGSILLTEKGDIKPVTRHPNFRLFGCMNPATDVGKRDLPPGLRSRMTEIYVDELHEEEDLRTLAGEYIKRMGGGGSLQKQLDKIVTFYMAAVKEAGDKLTDGANQKPNYSLRTLCRALETARLMASQYGVDRALYEGVCAAFLTQLSRESYSAMQLLIQRHIGSDLSPAQLSAAPPRPGPQYGQYEQFWLETGPEEPVAHEDTKFILTPSTKENLRRIARVLVTRKYPVLLQGPTSSGKTSMVEYLAKRTGHKFVRINNHEHTDLQEYLGSYVTDEKGRLKFKEGILVESVRKGYWVVLDELNLAPTDVLEALNRLLDDNRELFIPETQEVVKPHPHFQLFATQNPPGIYGGRKVLSRAFRNRFVELHFDDIPESELKTILESRSAIPPSYCDKLVKILKDLQKRRQGTRLFAGKHGFITLRDLFRWAERRPNGYQELANDGYMLLAEKVRREDEKLIVKQCLEKHLNVKISLDVLYSCNDSKAYKLFQESIGAATGPSHPLWPFKTLVWTKAMKRLLTIVERCVEHKEPILLVGETGCGKTTVCQLLGALYGQKLHILNCHQHTETADFLGGLRPVRGKEGLGPVLRQRVAALVERCLAVEALAQAAAAVPLSEDAPMQSLAADVEKLQKAIIQAAQQGVVEAQALQSEAQSVCCDVQEYMTLFRWYDGPLVTAMKEGDLFLIDEVSLADDSVLERLNSVLEPKRGLTLAEKGGSEVDEIIAVDSFRVFATMNPGGDFGKKELSPALRNRFTEIWVPSVTDHEDLVQIIEASFTSKALAGSSAHILDFINWFRKHKCPKVVVSLRDILSWVGFMNACVGGGKVSPPHSYVHGACLVLLDALGSGSSALGDPTAIRKDCYSYLWAQLTAAGHTPPGENFDVADYSEIGVRQVDGRSMFFAGAFGANCGPIPPANPNFTLRAPTTAHNVSRVLRAMQLSKPILLEGSPGVGKTSLITALGAAAGHPVVRINLSEQTDLMDLFGSDLPVEGGQSGEFAWRDGAFLQALKNGDWILLDELNLASQSVLEGLNACLDHRGTIFIPELGRTFECPQQVRIFACQNPLTQGGGRRGLPKSFLNRFTQVYVDPLQRSDLLFICKAMFPAIDEDTLSRMIDFNSRLHSATMVERRFALRGSPWEFNLRDVFRWCELMVANQAPGHWNPSHFVDLLYVQRMRTPADRTHLLSLYDKVFASETGTQIETRPSYHVTPQWLRVGRALLPRLPQISKENPGAGLGLIGGQLNVAENLMKCLQMGWMPIIIGPTAAGKTSVVRLLAGLTGNQLQEFAMNSAVDTTDLLGGFEQVDVGRHRRQLLGSVERLVLCTCEQILMRADTAATDSALMAIQQLHDCWRTLSCAAAALPANGQVETEGATEEEHKCIEQLLSQIDVLTGSWGIDLAALANEDTALMMPDALWAQLHALREMETEHGRGRFEWMDGALVTALQKGHWLLVDNANLCSPSVLDRLNPLLEPGGILIVSERGVANGAVQAVKPHPNFRLILAMDPRYGELSRAMRNRGVEIVIQEHHEGSHGAQPGALCEPTKRDMATLLFGRGLANTTVVQTLIHVHDVVRQTVRPSPDAPLTTRDLLHAGDLARELIERGMAWVDAVKTGCLEVYARSRRTADERASLAAVVEDLIMAAAQKDVHLLSAGHWPLLCGGHQSDATMATVCMQGAYLLHTASLHLQAVAGTDQICASKYPVVLASLPAPALAATFYGYPMPQPATPTTSADSDATTNIDYLARAEVASRLFVDAVTSTDHTHRLHYLHNALGGAVSIHPSMERLHASALFALERITQCPLSAQLLEARRSLAQVLGLDGGLLSSEPVAMPMQSEAEESLVTVLRAKGSGQADELWRRCSELAKRLVVYAARTQQLYREQETYAASQHTSATQLSLVQQSYRLYAGTLSSARVTIPAVRSLYPFFSALDSVVEGLLLDTTEGGCRPDALGLLEQMLFRRDRFWHACNTTTLHSDHVCPQWRWLLRSMHRLGTANQMGLPTHVTTLVAKLCTDLGTGMDAPERALWKYGMRPVGLSSEQLYELEGALQKLSARFDINTATSETERWQPLPPWILIGRDHPLLLQAAGGQREAIADGLATLYSIDEIDRTEEQGTSAQLLSAVREVPERLEGALPLPSSEGFPLSLGPQAVATLELWPVHDHKSLVEEHGILAQLLLLEATHRAAQAAGLDIPEAMDTSALQSQLQEHVARALLSTSRAPTDVVPFQRLLWKLSAGQSESPPTARGFGIGAIVPEALFALHNGLWHATFSDLSAYRAVAAVSEATLMAETDEGRALEKVRDSYVSQSATNGPARLVQAVPQAVAMHTVVTSQQVAIKELGAKSAQLRALADTVADTLVRGGAKGAPTNGSDWVLLASSFAATVLCLRKQMASPEAFVSLARHVHTVLTILPILCVPDDQSHAGVKPSDVDGERAVESCREITHLLRECKEGLVSGLVEKILVPLVGALEWRIGGEYDPNMESALCAHGWVCLGLAQIALLVPPNGADPAAQYRVKLEGIRQQVADIDLEMEVRRETELIATGREHTPEMTAFADRKHTLGLEEARLSNKVLLRPTPNQFPDVYSDLSHYASTLGNPTTVLALAGDLMAVVGGSNADVGNLGAREGVWVDSTLQFVRRLTSKYAMYRDVLLPVAVAAYQTVYGMRTLLSEAMRLLEERKTEGGNSAAVGLLLDMGRFPVRVDATLSRWNILVDLLQHLAPQTDSRSIRRVVGNESWPAIQARGLRAVMFRMAVQSVHTPTLESGALSALDAVFGSYLDVWEQQELAKARRAAEEQETFKFRAKNFVLESEEELEEREYRRMYPTFAHLFSDLEDASLDPAENQPQPMENGNDEDEGVQLPGSLSDSDMEKVARVHGAIYDTLLSACTAPACPTPSTLSGAMPEPLKATPEDRASAFSEAFTVAATLLDGMGENLPRLAADHATALDMACLLMARSAHSDLNSSIEIGSLSAEGTISPSAVLQKTARSYNIYTDSNTLEARRLYPVLRDMRVSIEKLLEQWPEHPILAQLLAIIDRILAFPVTSPLAKLLTGVELLLRKSQDWEQYAASHVSLATHIASLTGLVLAWRKLELGLWPYALAAKARESEQKTLKLWFHLYRLVKSSPFEEEGGGGDETIADHLREVFESLEQFFQTATYGDFGTRLGMVRQFACQLAVEGRARAMAQPQTSNDPMTRYQERLAAVLNNLLQYYSQFLPILDTRVSQQKAPIEKELKEAVKLAKWKDVNYWAMKQAGDKTHRVLHKHISRYGRLLQTPMRDIYATAGTQLDPTLFGSERPADSSAASRIESLVQRVSAVAMVDADHLIGQYVDTPMVPVGPELVQHLRLDDAGLPLNRLPALTRRYIRYCTEKVFPIITPTRVGAVEDLSATIIGRIRQFQEWDRTDAAAATDRAKDSKVQDYRKQHKVVKRKALSDLLRALRQIGLSYRSAPAADMQNVLHVMSLPAPPVASLLPSGEAVGTWERASQYYYRVLAHMVALRNAFLTRTTPDITQQEAERCHGFSEHLLYLLAQQRNFLADLTTEFASLRLLVAQSKKLHVPTGGDVPVPNQSQTRWWATQLASLLEQLLDVAGDMQVVLANANPPLSSAAVAQAQQVVSGAQRKLEAARDGLRAELFDWLSHYSGKLQEGAPFLVGPRAVETLQKTVAAIEGVLPSLSTLVSGDCGQAGLTHVLATCIDQSRDLLASYHQAAQSDLTLGDGMEPSAFLSTFEKQYNTFVSLTLKAVEDVLEVKKQQREEAKRRKEGTESDAGAEMNGKEDENDEEDDFEEGHLVNVNSGLVKAVKALRVPQLNQKAAELSRLVGTQCDSAQTPDQRQAAIAALQLLSRLYPILDRYTTLLEGVLSEYVVFHKTLCKLQYVLVNTFKELLDKGFCVPPDVSTKVEDEETGKENAGMGEGQGEKDVSDQIEDEEQVTGTQDQAPGEDRNDLKEEDNGMEMSADFEGNLYDVDQEDNKEDEEDEDEKKKDDLDEQMGDVNEQGETVNEKMWGEDESDEEPDKDEKKEEGNSMTNPNQESEMVAKDEEDQKDKKEKDKDKKKEEKKQQQESKPEPQEANEDEGEINEEPETEESSGFKPEGQPMEPQPEDDQPLPDEMDLDGDESEGGDENGEREEEEEESEMPADTQANEQQQQDFPSELDMDDANEDEGDEGGENEDKEETDDIGENAEETEGKPELMDEEGEDENEGEEEKNEETVKDDEEKVADPMSSDKTEQPKEENEGEDEAQKPQADHRQQQQQQPLGVEGTEEGKPSSGQAEQQNERDETAGSSMAMQTDMSTQNDEEASWQRSRQQSQDKQQQQERMRRQNEVNPYRSLGRALEEWKDRLRVLDLAEKESREEDEQPVADKQEGDADTYEYMRDEDKSQHDAQTLGIATEQQAAEQPPLAAGEEEQDDDDVMPMDEDQPSPPPQPPVEEEGQPEEQPRKKKDGSSNLPAGNVMAQQQEDEDEPMLDGNKEEGSAAEGEGEEVREDRDNLVRTEPGEEEEEEPIHLTEEDLLAKREELELTLQAWKQQQGQSLNSGADMWAQYDMITGALAQDLCEQLRVILEPSLATKLKGDYRTGKRLNMKKVIAYIASQFKKDKIWLRRTKPAKREYQVLLAIDDSESMADSHSVALAFESLTLISKALSRLEVGELGIVSFGDKVTLLHPFSEPFTDQSGGQVLQQFTFGQKGTNFGLLLETCLQHLVSSAHGTDLPVSQLQFVISDGICHEVDSLRKWVRSYADKGVLLVFIVLDNPKSKYSILEHMTVSYPGGRLTLTPYLDNFPFPYYVVLRDINTLPEILSDALRQWFELVSHQAE